MAGIESSQKKSVKISKGILYVFFTVYLIIIGVYLSGFIENYQNEYPGNLPVFANYIPLACYLGSIVIGISFIVFLRNTTAQKTRELKSKGKSKVSIYKQALFAIIFIFAFIPLFSPIIDQGVNNHNFSVYNSDWNGCSDFRQTMIDEGYDVMSIQSSLSATDRLDKSICLVLLGPNQFYNPMFEIPFFVDFFNGENALLICHDHGSTKELLWEILISSLFSQNATEMVPVTLFANGILRDNASYVTNPTFPVITQFEPHPTTNGINDVILSSATSAAGGPLVDLFGWNVLARGSPYSFVDKDGSGDFNATFDYLDLSFMAGVLPISEDNLKLPLGGDEFTPITFMTKDTGNVRVFVSSDASMWNNELIDLPGYDNEQFAKNVISWLTHQDEGDPKEDWVIAFDEAHIRPEYSRDLSSAGIYGFIMQYIIHLSTNPITAWIYPLLAIYTLSRYLPGRSEKKQKKKIEEQEKKEEKIRFRTSSFFAKKIDWYHQKNQYRKALLLLNRRLERKLHAQLGDQNITTRNVVDLVQSKDPNINKSKLKRIARFIDIITDLKAGKEKIKEESEFERLFFEMEWVVSNL
ncbi:MAG: conserved membrane protein of unknown function [Promethearchaeota archaeon]|jgi:hypothetical protein|nr:MAG: conserved membrane protein of unknown function [Candidatus Lokiarchaeota archaeon]